MECPYCLGREPDFVEEQEPSNEVTESRMLFDYINPEGLQMARWVWRFIHNEHGFQIDIHNCVDAGRWVFLSEGPWPTTPSAIGPLNAFLKYASGVTPGPKPGATLADILTAVKALGDSAGWTEIADHVASPLQLNYDNDAVRQIAKRAGLGNLKKLREAAKGWFK